MTGAAAYASLVGKNTLSSLIAAVLLASAAVAQEKKPAVPPGRDPGGMMVAVISTGIDYTLTAVAARLARDGEGELVGWDIAENDRRPFDRSAGGTSNDRGGDATAIASFVAGSEVSVRLVPVRVNAAEPASVARGVAFVGHTPARIALLPMWGPIREDWEPFRLAATHFKEILFIVPAGENSEPAFPASLGLANVLAVAAGSAVTDAAGFGGRVQRLAGPLLAVAAAGGTAAAILARDPRLAADQLKRKLLESEASAMWRPLK